MSEENSPSALCANKTIAIIDPDPAAGVLLEPILAARGCAVLTAGNATDGIALCRAECPDVVLFAGDLAGMDPQHFTDELIQGRGAGEAAVIPMVSAEAAGAAFTIEGVNDYIVNPPDAGLLIRKIEKHISTPLKKILVVDDSVESAALIEEVLKSRSYQVLKAHSGLEGLEAAKRELPDLVILDVMLPGINGYQVCRMLKFDRKYEQIAVVVLTARAQEEDRTQAREAGSDVYLVKPFSGDSLLGALKKLLWD